MNTDAYLQLGGELIIKLSYHHDEYHLDVKTKHGLTSLNISDTDNSYNTFKELIKSIEEDGWNGLGDTYDPEDPENVDWSGETGWIRRPGQLFKTDLGKEANDDCVVTDFKIVGTDDEFEIVFELEEEEDDA